MADLRDCRICGQPFAAARRNSTVCAKQDCRKRVKAEANARQRQKGKPAVPRPAAAADPEAHALDEAARAIHAVLTDAAARLAPVQDALGRDRGRRDNAETLFFTRLQALREATKAGEHAASRDALIDLISSAAAWAAKIDPDGEGQLPGPAWPIAKERPATPVQRDPARVPEAYTRQRYLEQLAGRVTDLDTDQALDRLERLLGLSGV